MTPSHPRNTAPTNFCWSILTVQDADVPAHAPLQPPNVDPESGWAWSVTKVLLGYRAPQVVDMPLKPLWQLIPGGLLVTLPLP